MIKPGTAKDHPHDVVTKAPAINDPNMLPTEVWEFHIPMIKPRLKYTIYKIKILNNISYFYMTPANCLGKVEHLQTCSNQSKYVCVLSQEPVIQWLVLVAECHLGFSKNKLFMCRWFPCLKCFMCHVRAFITDYTVRVLLTVEGYSVT